MTGTADLTDKLPEVPAAPSREILERAGQIFNRDKSIHWDDAVRMAGEQLATEAAERAEGEARTQAFVASFQRMTACGACGAPALGNSGGYCRDCRDAAAVLHGLARLDDDIKGHTRRDLIQADLERRAAPQRAV
jgi:hypothetical protein